MRQLHSQPRDPFFHKLDGDARRLRIALALDPSPLARRPGERLQPLSQHLERFDFIFDLAQASLEPPPLVAGCRRGSARSRPPVRKP